MQSIDSVTGKVSWVEQTKDTAVLIRSQLTTGSAAFTTDDEVYHVLTYNKNFSDATRVLKTNAWQISSADQSVTRMQSIDSVTGKVSWVEQTKDTAALIRSQLTTSASAFTTDD